MVTILVNFEILSDNQYFIVEVFLLKIKKPHFLLIIMKLVFLQTVLNSSNTIDKSDEYEHFKFGFNSEAGSLSYSLLTAPGIIFIKF